MPSYGEKQIPAGKECRPCLGPLAGERSMKSRDMSIRTSLKIDNIDYKGNAALRANKQIVEDIKLYVLNAGAFGVTMMDWLEPVLKITLLLITIGYTAHRWWLMKNNSDEKNK